MDIQDSLTILNRIYALMHIPGSVGLGSSFRNCYTMRCDIPLNFHSFIVWYYYVAPSPSTFAIVRRTMTLTNFLAFLAFVIYLATLLGFFPPNTSSWTRSATITRRAYG